MKQVHLQVLGESYNGSGVRGTIPSGFKAGVTLLAGRVSALRYPDKPDIIRPGEVIDPFTTDTEELSLPPAAAERTYKAFGDMLKPRRADKKQVFEGLCHMAGINVPERVEWPGEKRSSKYAWHKPPLGELALSTGYIAVNAEDPSQHIWPFWTLGDHRCALTFVPRAGLAKVRLLDMLRVGDFIRPMAELPKR